MIFSFQAPGAEKKSSSPKGEVATPAESITTIAYLTQPGTPNNSIINYKWLFQSDPSKSLQWKCLFRVPGASTFKMGPVIRHLKWQFDSRTVC